MESYEAGRDEMDVRMRISSPHQAFDVCIREISRAQAVLGASVAHIGNKGRSRSTLTLGVMMCLTRLKL